jgi:hypothetical protein
MNAHVTDQTSPDCQRRISAARPEIAWSNFHRTPRPRARRSAEQNTSVSRCSTHLCRSDFIQGADPPPRKISGHLNVIPGRVLRRPCESAYRAGPKSPMCFGVHDRTQEGRVANSHRCVCRERLVDSSGCESRPVTGRSTRKHPERFKEVTNWTEALLEKAPLGSQQAHRP